MFLLVYFIRLINQSINNQSIKHLSSIFCYNAQLNCQ